MMNYNDIIIVVFCLFTLYHVHIYLKGMNNEYCDGNILSILFFSNSNFCQIIGKLTFVIEGIFWNLI